MKKKIINFIRNPWVYSTGAVIIGTLLLRMIDALAGTKILKLVWSVIKWLLNEFMNLCSIKFEVAFWVLILFVIFLIISTSYFIKVVLKKPEGKNNPITQWEKDFFYFCGIEKVYNNLIKVADLIQTGACFSNILVPAEITAYYITEELIEATCCPGVYKFTPKGNYFLKKYFELEETK